MKIARCELEQTYSNVPYTDIAWILADILKLPWQHIQTTSDYMLAPAQYHDLIDKIEQLQHGQPLAYVLQKQPFWSLDLYVDPRVLIPRPETELLVEQALTCVDPAARVLDLGTGSGAIAAALATERPNWHITAVEYDKQAYQVAQHNFQTYNLKVNLIESNWFEDVAGVFDIIISNPPYIAEDGTYWPGLEAEPAQALYGGEDGLAAYRLIIPTAQKYLVSGGMLLLEHGYNQGQNVRDLLQATNYNKINTVRDYNQLERLSFGYTS